LGGARDILGGHEQVSCTGSSLWYTSFPWWCKNIFEAFCYV